MRVPRIFTAQPLAPHGQFQLEPGPSQHLSRALRMGPGDRLTLFDGGGCEYPATISAVDKKAVRVQTSEHVQVERESPLAVELGIAISRGERMDLVIQKATELGVTAIAPLFSERTEVRLKGERAGRKQQHWQQIAVSACEQCGRNRVPAIAALMNLEDWVGQVEARCRFVLHHRAGPGGDSGSRPDSAALLVGPEGGLSDGEISGALAAGFEAMQLGPRVLRTETAPLAALAILQARWGDMGPGD